MHVEPPVNRIGKLDLFGVFVPGFSICAGLGFALLAIGSPDGLLAAKSGLSGLYWPILLLFILFSYAAGMLPRAFPVSKTDEICLKHFRPSKGSCSEWESAFRRDPFPFPTALELSFEKLKKAVDWGKAGAPKITIAGSDKMCVFDYWKTTVTVRSPLVSEDLQALEARVRLFVGMFWAGCIGWGAGCCTLIVSSFQKLENLPAFVGLGLLFVSACLWLLGRGIRLWLFLAGLEIVLAVLIHVLPGLERGIPRPDWQALLLRPDWQVLHWCVPSLLVMGWYTFLLVVFGSQLRRVRAEEANQVMLAYLACAAERSAPEALPKDQKRSFMQCIRDLFE